MTKSDKPFTKRRFIAIFLGENTNKNNKKYPI